MGMTKGNFGNSSPVKSGSDDVADGSNVDKNIGSSSLAPRDGGVQNWKPPLVGNFEPARPDFGTGKK